MNQKEFNREDTSYEKGFTLIELLVSAAILMFLAGISVQGFVNYAHTQQYKKTVDEVRTNLQLARQQTLGSYNDSSYGVYVGATTIEFFQGTTPTVGDPDNTIIDVASLGLTATSSLHNMSNEVAFVTFARLTGAASATGTLSIVDPRSSATTTFTIYSSGLVE